MIGTAFSLALLTVPLPQDAPAPAVGEAPAAELVLRERKLGVMGTELEIRVIGPDAELLDAAIDAAVAEIQRVEDLMTDWRPSPLTELNDAAGPGPFQVPPELAGVIDGGVYLGELSDGAFDLTFAGVGKLWDFKRDPPLVPEPDQVRDALAVVDYRGVSVDLEANTVTRPEGWKIGLGGIAKGYGVDRAMAVLRKHGIRHAFVSAGGDLKALGRKFGEPWRIAVRHPRRPESVLALVPVSNTCVMTSGDYERFFEVDGRRYHHILDPRTGYPATGCISATVVAPDGAFADGLATALCVMEPAKGLALVEKLERVEAILVGLEGEVRISSGLRAPDER